MDFSLGLVCRKAQIAVGCLGISPKLQGDQWGQEQWGTPGGMCFILTTELWRDAKDVGLT